MQSHIHHINSYTQYCVRSHFGSNTIGIACHHGSPGEAWCFQLRC